ncbi:MAG TPA: agarase [Pseudolabrys sp.]
MQRTRWGGIADGRLQPGGYFRVAETDNIFWLIDPDGGRFLSKGVNTVRFDQDAIHNSKRVPYAEACARKYGSERAWRTAAAARLADWGFNTLGAWSDEMVADVGSVPLGVTPNLDLGMSFAWSKDQRFPDVFDPEFDVHVHLRARELCTPKRENNNLIGWFIDNELRWGPDWRGPEELLALFLNLPAASPGHRAAVAADPKTFTAQVAERYFALTTAAIRAADPHHLVLGCRFAYVPSPAVIEAAGRHADVVSFNCYEIDAAKAMGAYSAIGKPCLIGEFSFRAADSRLPNTNGAGPLVPTQAERAASFRRYVTTALRMPTIVGFHWFEHADQPAEGRFDGENSNFGTVTINDEVYEELTQAMKSVNAEAESLHASAGRIS